MHVTKLTLPFNLASTFYFYGVDNNRFKLKDLGTNAISVYEAVEDENDGYRSMLATVKVAEQKAGVFFRAPVDEVRIDLSEGDELDGFKLVSVLDGHVWLEVGTHDYSDYYPYFVFRYHPRSP